VTDPTPEQEAIIAKALELLEAYPKRNGLAQVPIGEFIFLLRKCGCEEE